MYNVHGIATKISSMTLDDTKALSLFILFNHSLTAHQEADARVALGVNSIVLPPEIISQIWAKIPPENAALTDWLEPVRDWVATQAAVGDFVLIQGEFGATFLMVEEALRLGLHPVYSTTHREMNEKHMSDGSVQISHNFAHVRYRRYGE